MNETYIINTDVLNNMALFDYWFKNMSGYRQEKISRMKLKKDKNLSLGVGILMDSYLKKIGLTEKEMLYINGKNGKPFFKNKPHIFFNASHSGNVAICSFSDDEIGCDVEDDAPINIKIAERFFTVNENQYIASASTQKERQRCFLRFWTLKESYLKCTGTGLHGGLNSFEISLFQNDDITAYEKGKRVEVYFKEYSYSGFYISVCAKNPSFAEELVTVKI